MARRKSEPETEDQMEEDDQAVSGSEAGEELDNGEYEIEQILKFDPEECNGNGGYYVKWKGYGSDENTWCEEGDMDGSKQLLKEFWKKRGGKPKKGKKATGPASSAANGSASTKGRRRVSTEPAASKRSAKRESSDDEEEVVVNKSVGRKTRRMELDEEEEDQKVLRTEQVENLSSKKSWESVVKHIDTVERASNGSLMVYFHLQSGQRCVEAAPLCREKFPQKLLDFYESNLRWREEIQD